MWTLDEARQMLATWLECERAIASGQQYSIGSRSLSRPNLAYVAQQVETWRKRVAELEANGGKMRRGCRVFRGVPRDF